MNQHWLENRIIYCNHSLLSPSGMSHCQKGDLVSVSRLCAHYFLDLDVVIEKSSLHSAEISFSEKLQHIANKKTFSEIRNAPDRVNFDKLTSSLFDMLYSSLNLKDDLLIASKQLKLNLKQLLQLFSPELFYQLLLVGGNLLRLGDDFSKV